MSRAGSWRLRFFVVAGALDGKLLANQVALVTGASSGIGYGIDIVVANAKLQKDGKFADMTLDDWQHVLSTNLTGQFLTCPATVKVFRRRGPTSRFHTVGSAPWKISATRPYVPGLFEQWLKPNTRTIGVAVVRLLE
ncbi:NAD(P)-dependent dehydrogenase (short-subunit alcohol dehydrogenase family) [Paraburkholderia sp. MM5384-R2]|nr:NAD(P)-dependent dehydrogenase (short-subunit alcohol dehydrogenase family) [Paraburkholderia sp. MM5384-R2]